MIHSTAIVDPGAKLGKDVSVGPFAYIERDVQIGDGCVVGPHVSILRFTSLGNGCQVHAGAVLGDVPQDLGFQGVESCVRVGSKCIIREGVTIHRGTKAGTATEIGDECFLMAFSHFAHNVKLGKNVIVANAALLAGYVEVGERAFISGNVVIHQFTRIGRLAMLGGACGIGKDVPPFCTAKSMGLNRILGLNIVGLRRAGFTPEQRKEIKQAFAIVYRSGLNVSQAVEKLGEEFKSGPAQEFCEFIRNSHRGICGAAEESEDEGAAER